MEIRTKFNAGDNVYGIEQIRTKMQCPECKGHSKKLIGNTTYYCRECLGTGEVESDETKWKVIDNLIHIKTVYVIDSITDRRIEYYTQNHSRMFLEYNVFATKEQAQAECDRRNKENV